MLPALPDVDPAAADLDGPPSELLAAYGIEVVPSTLAGSVEAAIAAAATLGYPVALKAAGGALRHRIDLGAVRLALADEDDVRAAYRELSAAFGPDVLVQTMVAPGVACTSRWWRTRRSARSSASGWAAWPASCSATWPGGRRR